jgi:DnaJ-class molecular chaperone
MRLPNQPEARAVKCPRCHGAPGHVRSCRFCDGHGAVTPTRWMEDATREERPAATDEHARCSRGTGEAR